jgi:hypothetical protein
MLVSLGKVCKGLFLFAFTCVPTMRSTNNAPIAYNSSKQFRRKIPWGGPRFHVATQLSVSKHLPRGFCPCQSRPCLRRNTQPRVRADQQVGF